MTINNNEGINKDELVTFDDGTEYFVIDIVHHNNQKYIYFAKEDKKVEVFIAKEVIEDGKLIVEVLDDGPEKEEVMKKLLTQMLKDKN
ncbi:MAG: DUF1292 domain-containing protein [Bacilli bacterium]|jgi:hypothetical protein|nr:DUF1292 domain-containing protein [Bacilli bacterium]